MTIKDIVLIALFSALIAVMGFLPAFQLAFQVPITVQTLGVMLAGAMLGAKRGLCSILIVWILVAAGLPILSVGRGGLSQFFAPTSGYLYGWALGVVVIGFLYQMFKANLTPTKEAIILVIGGVIAIHLPGVLWLALTTSMTVWQALLADLIFIPGDLVKVALCYFIVRNLRRALPNLTA